MAHPSTFSTDELETALTEVGEWGLAAWEVLPPQFSPPDEARAKLELLEKGDTAVVGVSYKGWKVCLRSVVDIGRLPADSAAKDDQSFETLEHLLAYLSPEFEDRRIKLLSERLEKISVDREWNEGTGDAEAEDAPSTPSSGSQVPAKEAGAAENAAETP